MEYKEIIKALECCHVGSNCGCCPYNEFRTKSGLCVDMLYKDAFTLINRQQAEIERLTYESEVYAKVNHWTNHE